MDQEDELSKDELYTSLALTDRDNELSGDELYTSPAPAGSAGGQRWYRSLLGACICLWTLIVSGATRYATYDFDHQPYNSTATDPQKPALQPPCSWAWAKEYGIPVTQGLCKLWAEHNLRAMQDALDDPVDLPALAPSAMAWIAMAARPIAPPLATLPYRLLKWAIGG